MLGVGKETAYQHWRHDFDALPPVLSVVVVTLLDNALPVLVVGQLHIHRPVEFGFEPRPQVTKEIDFVGEKQGDKLYVQVCYLLSDEATSQREFGSLLEVRDNYPKLVLYKEGSFRGNYEGIPAIRIEGWLTGKNV